MDDAALACARETWARTLGNEATSPHALCALVWRARLGDLPLDNVGTWSAAIKMQRRAYRHLRTKCMKKLHETMKASVPDDEHPLQGGPSKTLWQRRDEAQELAQLMELDMSRLDPPREAEAHAALTRILTVWAYAHADLGYHQGMHEVAARLWDARTRESIPSCTKSFEAQAGLSAHDLIELLDPDEAEADTFFLFTALLHRLEPHYDVARAGPAAMLKAILYRVDPVLGEHLSSLQIEWQPILMCVSPHTRLTQTVAPAALFTRADAGLKLVPYVSAAMIMARRDRLLVSDYVDAMQLLMHSPLGDDPIDPTTLVTQAKELHDAPSRATGAAVAAAFRQQGDAPASASERLLELTRVQAQRVVEEIARLGAQNDLPEWSPRAEDRLRSDAATQDKEPQRRRAMLSLDDADAHDVDA